MPGFAAGSHRIYAVYNAQLSGNAYYLRASTSTPVAINPITTQLTLTPLPNKITSDTPFDLTATMTALGSTPGGVIIFKDGGTTLGIATLVGGVAVFHDAGLLTGKHRLYAVYESQVIGDHYYLSSRSTTLAVSV